MYWPFKTTIAFRNDDGNECRMTYAVSAGDMIDAKCEMERRLHDLGIFSYTIEAIVAATNREADRFKLPEAAFLHWIFPLWPCMLPFMPPSTDKPRDARSRIWSAHSFASMTPTGVLPAS